MAPDRQARKLKSTSHSILETVYHSDPFRSELDDMMNLSWHICTDSAAACCNDTSHALLSRHTHWGYTDRKAAVAESIFFNRANSCSGRTAIRVKPPRKPLEIDPSFSPKPETDKV